MHEPSDKVECNNSIHLYKQVSLWGKNSNMEWYKDIDNAIFPNEDDKDKSIYRIIPFDTLFQNADEHIILLDFLLIEYKTLPRYMTLNLSLSR